MVCSAKGWTGPPDCHELREGAGILGAFLSQLQSILGLPIAAIDVTETTDSQMKAYEKCFIRLLAENDQDDWLEIIFYFKNNILPIANDINKGQYKDALWRFNSIVVKKESMSFITEYILPYLEVVDKETLEMINSVVHSQTYGVVLHVTGFINMGVTMLLDTGNGRLFCTVMRGALHGALSAIGMDSLFPEVSTIFNSFVAGNYQKGMALAAALPISLAKGLLWLLPIPHITRPIVSELIDFVKDNIVEYMSNSGFLYSLATIGYEIISFIFRSVNKFLDTSYIAASQITAVIQEVIQKNGVRRLH